MSEPVLEAIGLRKVYERGRVAALRGVDLELSEGEILAVRGPSGSGKSTLLNFLAGLDLPTEGEVRFRGTPLVRLPSLSEYRNRHVGFVFQAFHLLPTLTALQNVQVPMFPLVPGGAARRDKAQKLLAEVGLEGRMHHFPDELSSGERQRVAIARSLANDPDLLLADEPTGNLDSENSTMVLDMLCRIQEVRGTAMVIVTHEAEVAERAKRTVTMRDGRLT